MTFLEFLDDLWVFIEFIIQYVSSSHHFAASSPCDVVTFWTDMLTLFWIMIFQHQSWGSIVEAHSIIMISSIVMMKREHGVMDRHLLSINSSYHQHQFSNQQQSSENPASKQLATNLPALTGSDFEIVNSIVWKLSLILAKVVPEPDTPEKAYKIYRSTSTF